LDKSRLIAQEIISKPVFLKTYIGPQIFNPYPLDINSAFLYTPDSVSGMSTNGISYDSIAYITEGQFSDLNSMT
jgi:hypothetical protein